MLFSDFDQMLFLECKMQYFTGTFTKMKFAYGMSVSCLRLSELIAFKRQRRYTYMLSDALKAIVVQRHLSSNGGQNEYQ